MGADMDQPRLRTTLSAPALLALLCALALLGAACTTGEEVGDVEGADAVVENDEMTETEILGANEADDPMDETTPAPETEGAVDEQSYEVSLSGDAEVPGPGSDGTGEATVTFADGQVCVEGTTTDVDPVQAGHIHTGTAEESGGVLVDLQITTAEDGMIDSCVDVDPATAEEITADPAGHYLNLHTADFPDGAVRGQLA